MAMQFYLGGISHPGKSYCNASSIDHAVLIVGFGVKGKKSNFFYIFSSRIVLKFTCFKNLVQRHLVETR